MVTRFVSEKNIRSEIIIMHMLSCSLSCISQCVSVCVQLCVSVYSRVCCKQFFTKNPQEKNNGAAFVDN